MSSRIVIRHRPRHGQEAEQEREANWSPARSGLNMSKDIGGIMPHALVGLGKQRDAASHQDGQMEDDIRASHLLHPASGQRVENTAENGQRGHDTDSHSSRRSPGEIAAHRDRCQQHLCRPILGRGNSGNLAQQVDPPGQPTNRRDPSRGS